MLSSDHLYEFLHYFESFLNDQVTALFGCNNYHI